MAIVIATRQHLVGRRVAAQNRIRAIFVAQGLPAPRGVKAWSESGLAGIAAHAKALCDCGADEVRRGLLDLALTEYRQTTALVAQAEARLDALGKQNTAVKVLQTAPGLGPRTAEAVAAYLHEPARFTSGKQVSAYSGWCPGSINRASWIGVAGSHDAARRCSESCWSNAPGACCATTPGREATTSV